MNTRTIFLSACIAALAIIDLPAEDARTGRVANDGDGAIQIITDGTDESTEPPLSTHDGVMEPVVAVAGQQITITLQTPNNPPGDPVGLSPLDGGQVIAAQNLSVANDRTVTFSFQPGVTLGLYRILATVGTEQCQLQVQVRPRRRSELPPILPVDPTQ
jgi:hypothetical protein